GSGLLLTGKAQAIEDLADARLDRVAASVLELILEVSVARENCIILLGAGNEGGVSKADGQGVELVLQGEEVGEDGEHLVVEGTRRVEVGDLRQVATAQARGVGDAAFIRIELADEELEQSRLAGAVWPHETDAVMVLQAEGDAGEDELGAEVFGKVGDNGE